MNSAGGVMRAAGRAQVVRAADPDASFERLEAHPHAFGASHGLRAAGNLTVGEIGLNQIDQGSTGLAGIGRRQRMRENPGLNFVAAGGVAEHRALEFVEHHQYRAQCVVRDIAGTPRAAHESQVQQATHAAPFIVQAERQRPMQIGDQEHGFGRDMVGVRCDRYFREIFSQMGTLCDPQDAAPNLKIALPSKSRFLPITKGTVARFKSPWTPIDKDRH